MKPKTDRIHVMPLGDNWEVEAQSGAPLAHDDKKEGAIETAKDMAAEQNIPFVILHDGDGVTEKVPVRPTEHPETIPPAHP